MTSSEQDKIFGCLKQSTAVSDFVYEAGKTKHIVYKNLFQV